MKCLMKSLIGANKQTQKARSAGGGIAGNSAELVLPLVMLVILSSFQPLALASTGTTDPCQPGPIRPKSIRTPLLYVTSGADFRTQTLSKEAVQLAEQLNVMEKLKRLDERRDAMKATGLGQKPSAEARLDLLELKQEVEETLEQCKYEVDYVTSAISAETAMEMELVRSYTNRRDKRVFWSNDWSYRTNGVLWTIAEALSIPTYNRPRYSVSAGTIGILAGLVPTAFSLLALRESAGGGFVRHKVPTMFNKLFGYPVIPAIDYPESVWKFLDSAPPHKSTPKTRINILIDQWIADKNIHLLTNRSDKTQLDLLTGSVKQRLTVDLLSDRVTMLTQLGAMVSLMNRPLLELMLVLRGAKHS